MRNATRGINRALGLALAGLMLALTQMPTAAAQVVVSDAWATPPLVRGRPIAAYMTLTNQGSEAVTLVAAESPAARRIVIHTAVHENNIVRMQPAGPVAVPAGGKLQLQPGGLHLMLFDPRPDLEPGSTFRLRLRFADGTSLETRVSVRSQSEHARKGARPE